MTARGLERLGQVRLLQVPAAALGMEPLGDTPGQHVGRDHRRPATSLGELLALCHLRPRPVHSRRHLLLEAGGRKALVPTGVLALQLPRLALLRWPLSSVRALCAALGWPVDILDELARRLRGGRELAHLPRRGHGRQRCGALRRGTGLLG